MADNIVNKPSESARQPAQPAQANHTSHTNHAAAKRAAPESGRAHVAAARDSADIATRRDRQFLIGVRALPGGPASSAEQVHDTLAQMEGVEIVRRLRPKGLSFAGSVHSGVQEIIVARMEDRRAEALRLSAPLQIAIEEDARLVEGPVIFPVLLDDFRPVGSVPVVGVPCGRQDYRFRVVGADDQPVPGAGITLFGQDCVAQAVTDNSGTASLSLFAADAGPEAIRAVHIHPAADHWECFVTDPRLEANGANPVKLTPLRSSKPSGDKRMSWGLQSLGLDPQAEQWTGSGVRVGLIDSGCDNSHPLLRHITQGHDCVGQGNGTGGWVKDAIGQGTHCAGIIAGAAGVVPGVQGVAPAVELHVYRVAPAGHCSDLVEALDRCIEEQMDVVHIGVASERYSELVAQKLMEARMRGIACIVPAGDTGAGVQFPAMVPGTLCVGAVGRLGEFAERTHHALTAIPELIAPGGFFATRFSAAGPQVAVCGPGVAILSSVPGGGLAARDGTAAACAHIAGFAALILAHHPLFRGLYGGRNEQRVNALFDLIRASAQPPIADPMRVGAGLPDLRQVPALQVPSGMSGWGQFGGVAAMPTHLPGAQMALMQLRALGLF